MDALQKVYAFYESYGGEKRVIGRSVCGQPIVALFVGEKGYPQLIVQYAIHAREWVTALLAPEHIRRGVPRGGCWFLPCTNPDGAALALRGEAFLQTLPRERAEWLRRVGGGGFRLWKANANAVDLNVNFDADWGRGVQNVRAPAPENYIGAAPFSEPETRALRDFTLEVSPDATVSYHTKGEEIYWHYGQTGEREARDGALAEALARATGYAARRIAGSSGGYKDWCIQACGIPAFTIEAGRESAAHPLGEAELPQLLGANADVPAVLSEELWKTR